MGRKKVIRENAFQTQLRRELRERFPGCYVLKNDPHWIQGIPDFTILYKDRWASLEIKRSAKSHKQPNQERHVERMNAMSYSAFIYPENKEEIFNELERTFKTQRPTCEAESKSTDMDQ